MGWLEGDSSCSAIRLDLLTNLSGVVYTKAVENYSKGDKLFHKYYDQVQNKTVVKVFGLCLGGYTWVNHALSTVEAYIKGLKKAVPKLEDDVSTVMSEVKELKGDFEKLKNSVKELKEDHVHLKQSTEKLKEAFVGFHSHMISPVPPARGALRSYLRHQELSREAWKKMWMV